MPQNTNAATIAVNTSGAQKPATIDAGGNLMTASAGLLSKLNVTAVGVIKASAGRIAKIVITNPGTAGALTINDLSANTGAAAANQVVSLAYNAASMVAGGVITLDFPVSNGIVISAIPTGAQLSISYS